MELYDEYEHKKAELQYNHEQEMSNLKEKYTNEESDLKKSLSVNMKNLKNEKSIIVEKEMLSTPKQSQLILTFLILIILHLRNTKINEAFLK